MLRRVGTAIPFPTFATSHCIGAVFSGGAVGGVQERSAATTTSRQQQQQRQYNPRGKQSGSNANPQKKINKKNQATNTRSSMTVGSRKSWKSQFGRAVVEADRLTTAIQASKSKEILLSIQAKFCSVDEGQRQKEAKSLLAFAEEPVRHLLRVETIETDPLVLFGLHHNAKERRVYAAYQGVSEAERLGRFNSLSDEDRDRFKSAAQCNKDLTKKVLKLLFFKTDLLTPEYCQTMARDVITEHNILAVMSGGRRYETNACCRVTTGTRPTPIRNPYAPADLKGETEAKVLRENATHNRVAKVSGQLVAAASVLGLHNNEHSSDLFAPRTSPLDSSIRGFAEAKGEGNAPPRFFIGEGGAVSRMHGGGQAGTSKKEKRTAMRKQWKQIDLLDNSEASVQARASLFQ